MTLNRTKLGKGLAALIPDKISMLPSLPPMIMNSVTLPLESIESSDTQPRKTFENEALTELADSIRSNGVLHPIIVRKNGANNSSYTIIAGERRWRASKLAGLTEIPVIIKNISDKKALEISIIENIQREDLNALEEGEAYQNLKDQFSYTDDEIATIVGKSRSYIANFRRILHLPTQIKELILNKKLSMGHAKILASSKFPELISEKIISNNLTVRQTEQLIKNEEKERIIKNKEKDKNLILLEEKLSEKLGLKVKIKDNNQIGFLTIEFKNLEELNMILKKLS